MYLTPLVDHGDARAPGQCWGLDDPLGSAAALLPHSPEQLGVGRKTKSPRQKAELLLSELQSKAVIIFPKSILTTDVECT